MTNKKQKRTQKKYSLRDEPILQPPRIFTTEDHSHSARGQLDMANWMPTTTHERERTHHGCAVDKGKAPIVVTRGSNKRVYNERGGKQQALSVASQNEFMDMLLGEHTSMSNHHCNIRMEESRIDNEQMNRSHGMDQPYDIHREELRIQNELMNGSYEMDNHATERLWEESRNNDELMNEIYEMNDQHNNRVRDELRVEDEQGDEIVEGSTKKAHRGPTYMRNVWGRPSNLPRFHVEFNEFGQPIDGKDSNLCHFLGSIARNGRFCPIDVMDWREMPSRKKIDMLDAVKLHFDVPITTHKWILSSIGEKWKNWKHFLKKNFWKDVPVLDMTMPKDDRIVLHQWFKLITYWGSDEAKEASKRNKGARAKKTMKQITGKRSFAKVRAKLTKKLGRPPKRSELFGACYVKPNENSSNANEKSSGDALHKYLEMQERNNQLAEGTEDPIDRNDVFAQTMGPDRPGHVRMMGKGICPSDIWGAIPKSTSNRLLMEQQSRIKELETMLLGQQRCGASQVPSRQQGLPVNSLSNHATTNLSLTVGAYVSLKSLFDQKKIVAKGRINSLNPCTEVGGQILGSNWCEVNVKVLLEPEEELIRPYENLQKIEDTLGEMIAWPCHLVICSEG
ncbi:hypothetical protein ACS0TY_019186 [Phlomoides rotata]